MKTILKHLKVDNYKNEQIEHYLGEGLSRNSNEKKSFEDKTQKM